MAFGGCRGTPLHQRSLAPRGTPDGAREQRAYYCQNWRNDVVAILKKGSGSACSVMEAARCSAYGVPFGLPPGDVDGDGDVDQDDNDNWPASYEVRCDYDLDGDMDTADHNLTIANTGRTLGRGVLSHSSVGNRKGYAGYEHDGVIHELCHVRHRAYHADLGRFLQRDPAGYADGPNLYEYVAGNPVAFDGPMGLEKETPLCAINTPGRVPGATVQLSSVGPCLRDGEEVEGGRRGITVGRRNRPTVAPDETPSWSVPPAKQLQNHTGM